MYFRHNLDTEDKKFHMPIYLIESKDESRAGIIFPVLTYNNENSLSNDNIIYFANKFNIMCNDVYSMVDNGYFIDEEMDEEYNNTNVSWFGWFSDKFIEVKGSPAYCIRYIMIHFRKSSKNNRYNQYILHNLINELILDQSCILIQLYGVTNDSGLEKIQEHLYDQDNIDLAISNFNSMILSNEIEYDDYGMFGGCVHLKKIVEIDELIDQYEMYNKEYLIRVLQRFSVVQDMFKPDPIMKDIFDEFKLDSVTSVDSIEEDIRNGDFGTIFVNNIIKEEEKRHGKQL